mmetsp:Transcript_24946/g.80625  ORF Transcript_24946/g.80625 Transcript_24946/m.80625 type:complete len:311 (+) Transcript_24946:498-1430(+)|eukprot:scaffold1002_cov117-Isochrysis_galbana.AAC.15
MRLRRCLATCPAGAAACAGLTCRATAGRTAQELVPGRRRCRHHRRQCAAPGVPGAGGRARAASGGGVAGERRAALSRASRSPAPPATIPPRRRSGGVTPRRRSGRRRYKLHRHRLVLVFLDGPQHGEGGVAHAHGRLIWPEQSSLGGAAVAHQKSQQPAVVLARVEQTRHLGKRAATCCAQLRRRIGGPSGGGGGRSTDRQCVPRAGHQPRGGPAALEQGGAAPHRLERCRVRLEVDKAPAGGVGKLRPRAARRQGLDCGTGGRQRGRIVRRQPSAGSARPGHFGDRGDQMQRPATPGLGSVGEGAVLEQ